jgi:hypothetical protein
MLTGWQGNEAMEQIRLQCHQAMMTMRRTTKTAMTMDHKPLMPLIVLINRAMLLFARQMWVSAWNVLFRGCRM